MKPIYFLAVFLFLVAFTKAQPVAKVLKAKQQVVCLAYSPDGKYLASGGFDSEIKIWDVSSGTVIKLLSGLKDFPVAIKWDQSGKILVSGGKDEKVTVWDVQNGKILKTLVGHKGAVRCVDISPDSKFIASGSDDNTIIIWDFNSGMKTSVLKGHEDQVAAVSFNPIGNLLASGGVDKKIIVWNTSNWSQKYSFIAHSKRVRCMTFSPDGEFIASGGDDKIINIWNSSDGTKVNSIRAHRNWVYTLAYSPDGKYIISGGHDNYIIMISQEGKIVYQSPQQKDYILSVAFDPNGKEFSFATLYSELITRMDVSSFNIGKIKESRENLLAEFENQQVPPKITVKNEKNFQTFDSTFTLNLSISSISKLTLVEIYNQNQKIAFFDAEDLSKTAGKEVALTRYIYLSKGTNKIFIKALNTGGTDTITYRVQRKEIAAPLISWISLAKGDSTVTDSTINLRWNIKTGLDISTISVICNNAVCIHESNLKPDGKSKMLLYSRKIALREGQNSILLVLNTKAGKTSSIAKNVFYNKPVQTLAVTQPVEKAPEMENTQVFVPVVVPQPVAVVTPPPAPEAVVPVVPVVASNPYKFALIIGNEDYHSFQTGLNSEADVQFAENDATAFRDYAVKYLGVPDENIVFKINARFIDMKRMIKKMSGIIEMTNGKAIVYFYYAGHGFPDENTKEPYFVPVDGSGTDLEFSAIKQKEVYDELTAFPSQRITIFIDACFSGGARNQGLVSARAVKVKPKIESAEKNMVVFTASSEDQSSLPYPDMKHGMFTYFLLKKLEETAGSATYKDLSDFLTEQVGIRSFMVNSKKQVPQTNVSPSVQDQYEKWKVNE